MSTSIQGQGLTPQAFFARRIKGALMVDAQRTTGIAYSTIHRIAQGEDASGAALKSVARWSIENPAARAVGVFISLDAMVVDTATLAPDGPQVVREGFDQTGTGGA